jgi:hypothetical protein
METVQSLKDKVTQLDADVQAIKAKPAVATQQDLDDLGAGIDKVSADLAPLK